MKVTKLRPEEITTVLLAVLSVVLLRLSGIGFDYIPHLLLNDSYLIFLTLGTVFILSVSEIDISTFGIVSLSVLGALYINYELGSNDNLYTLIGLIISFSVILSLLNAFLVIRLNWDSILATIATLSLFSGLTLIIYNMTYLHSRPNAEHTGMIRPYEIPADLERLLEYNFLSIEINVFLIALIMILVSVFINRTKLGLKLMAVGQSSLSASYCSINVAAIKLTSFILAGLMYGVGGILYISDFDTTNPGYLAGDIVIPIMCAVLSGADINGGRLPIIFTIAGVVTYSSLTNIVNVLIPGNNADAYSAFFGSFLIVYLFVRYKTSQRR